MKYYDKMHYEEELDLLCRCIRANISIILHKTVYEINSTLLLRTHFKPPSSVCNNFILRSHTLWAAAVHYISSPKNRNLWLCHFSRLYFQNSLIVRGKTPTLATLVRCTLFTYEHNISCALSLSLSLSDTLALSRALSLSLSLSLSSLSHTLARSLSLSLSTFASLSSSRAPHNHTI